MVKLDTGHVFLLAEAKSQDGQAKGYAWHWHPGTSACVTSVIAIARSPAAGVEGQRESQEAAAFVAVIRA